jgi:hypothetical protein
MRRHYDGYAISDDLQALDLDCTAESPTYSCWASGTLCGTVKKFVRRRLCFGLLDRDRPARLAALAAGNSERSLALSESWFRWIEDSKYVHGAR